MCVHRHQFQLLRLTFAECQRARTASSATDKTVAFGGSNNIWVVFEDYVVVIDANFPKEAGDVIKAIKKTTNKPIRYVFDTHHHGDHSYGNAVFSAAGASI